MVKPVGLTVGVICRPPSKSAGAEKFVMRAETWVQKNSKREANR